MSERGIIPFAEGLFAPSTHMCPFLRMLESPLFPCTVVPHKPSTLPILWNPIDKYIGAQFNGFEIFSF